MGTAVNSIGLALDIAGALLLIFYSVPRDTDEVTRIVTEDSQIPAPKKLASDKKWERAGLILLIAGFACQLVSNYL
jgi:hypothetical protein